MEPLTINRFPIFGAWCYAIARRLGYSEDEAKSLAVTRAKLGAAARGGMLGHGTKPPSRRAERASDGAAKAVDQVAFVGMRPFVTHEDGQLRGVLSREVVPPRQYETSVARKLGEAYPQVLRLMERLADSLPPQELNAQGYHLWEQFAPMVRDADGHESRPHFGQRGVFDPAKVERLISAESATERKKAA